jgi:hypothetical protein
MTAINTNINQISVIVFYLQASGLIDFRPPMATVAIFADPQNAVL